MSKLKFDKKWKEDQAYSPTHEWGDEPSFEVENVTIDEPSSVQLFSNFQWRKLDHPN